MQKNPISAFNINEGRILFSNADIDEGFVLIGITFLISNTGWRSGGKITDGIGRARGHGHLF